MDLDNSILFNKRTYSKDDRFKDLTCRIYADLNIKSKKDEKMLLRTLNGILLHLHRASDRNQYDDVEGVCVAVPRGDKSFTHHNRYGFKWWRGKNVRLLLDRLINKGYINQTLGSPKIGLDDHGFTTRIEPTLKLEVQWFDAYDYPNIGTETYDEKIILRNEFGAEVNYQDSRQRDRDRDWITKYNKLTEQTTIQYNTTINTTSNKSDLYLKTLNTNKKLHRIFSRVRFDLNGRFYGPSYQQLSSNFRSGILINNQSTTELDFSALHSSMLYHMNNTTLQHDPYILFNDPQTRPLGKIIALVSINAPNWQCAYKAIEHKLKACEEKHKVWSLFLEKGKSIPQLSAEFKRVNSTISNFIYSDYGIRLMFKDSEVTRRVLNHFTKKNIPVLPIHDSYRIQSQHADELRSVMENSYKQVMSHNVHSIDVKE